MSMNGGDVPDQLIYAFAGEEEITGLEAYTIAAGLARVLTIVEREHEIEMSKLRGAFDRAANSRELWKSRAVAAGWKKP